MKKVFSLTVLLLVFSCAGWAGAGGDFARVKQFFDSLPPDQRAYWQVNLQCVSPVSEEVVKEKGFKEALTDWLSGANKERQINALGDYLYNMYIASAAQGGVPPRLDLRFMGVLDLLALLPAGYEAGEMEKLYEKEKERVQARIARRFAAAGKWKYRLRDAANEDTERQFLRVLKQSAPAGRRTAGYWTAPTLGEDTTLAQELAQGLAQSFPAQKCGDGSRVCTYEQIDFMNMLDNPRARTQKQLFYRPASEECDACSYTFCREACRKENRSYEGWTLTGLRRIYARPAQGGTLRPADGGKFVSPAGQPYPDWDYHAAVLLTLRKGEQQTLAVQDPFLFGQAVSLSAWAEKFDAEETVFYAVPFRRREQAEKQFVALLPDQVEKVRAGKPVNINGVQYLPYPVRK